MTISEIEILKKDNMLKYYLYLDAYKQALSYAKDILGYNEAKAILFAQVSGCTFTDSV